MKFPVGLHIIIPIILVLLAVVGGGGYYYFKLAPTRVAKTTSASSQKEEVVSLVAEVSKLIDLPLGEDPTVATVTDISKLKDQPFFQRAKNGDKVLIYTQTKKAILYDPIARKIIDVAPINIGSPAAQLVQAVQPKVVLRNGTKTAGLAAKIEAELKKSMPDLNVITKENADNDYETSLVVVLNDSAKDLGNRLTETLNSESGVLPEGESKPKDGDILVILGKDRI